ncbi:MAG: hypothetical protein KatS3mg082_2615 [Nitrospiraceae bacterium]|nr:MAG: hypothetical protein KatS3mg082_2615 [Nitrospiraceae bacterium]
MKIEMDVCGKAVEIWIEEADQCRLRETNDRIAVILEFLVSADVVKYYKNRIDWFLVFPQNGIEPAELLVELKKRVRL